MNVGYIMPALHWQGWLGSWITYTSTENAAKQLVIWAGAYDILQVSVIIPQQGV